MAENWVRGKEVGENWVREAGGREKWKGAAGGRTAVSPLLKNLRRSISKKVCACMLRAMFSNWMTSPLTRKHYFVFREGRKI